MINAIKRKLYLWLAERVGLEAWPPGHYYSALPKLGKDAKPVAPRKLPIPGLRIDLKAVHLLLEQFVANEATISVVLAEGRYYSANNEFFSGLDAVALVHLLHSIRPRQVIEIGGGHSTALMLDTVDALGLETQITVIEPYPERLITLLAHSRLKLKQDVVENIDTSLFGSLGAGDILFIDSSHIVKSGSDVLYLFNDVLPRLPVGVLVHFHDIYIPDDYPLEWRQERRAWNESYFLHCFLMFNDSFETVFGSHLAARNFASIAHELGRKFGVSGCGGSFWLRRCLGGIFGSS